MDGLSASLRQTAAGILVEAVSKSYDLPGKAGRKRALQRVDLTVASGEFVCLLGPSGCGKTTLLNIIGGLDTEFEGVVQFTALRPRGERGFADRLPGEVPASPSVQSLKPTIGYVFQEARLLPWMNVRDNVRFVLDGVDAKVARALVDDWLARVGLRGYEEYYPGQLSIGMQQRVAVARALIVEPDILLMDEPMSSLDELTALRMRDELLALWMERRCTVVFVTHNPLEAVYLADRVVVMTASPGRIVEQLDVGGLLPRPRSADDAAVWKLSRRAVGLLLAAGGGEDADGGHLRE